MEINKDLIAASSTPIVLAILAEEDSYGYAILQRVRELSGGQHGVDGRDALPGSAPARAARPRRGAVGGRRERPPPQVLPDHARRGRAQLAEERRQWQAVDATLRGIWQALSVSVPTSHRRQPRHCRREPDDVDRAHDAVSLEEQIDQWRSYLRRRQAIHSVDVAELEDHLREQVAALIDGGARHRRSVPGGGQAHGRPRRAVAGVRARALGAALEAARRARSDAGGGAGAGPNGGRRRLRSRGGGGRADQGAGALRARAGRGRRLLRPQREPLRAAPADRLLRLEAAARARGARSAGWPSAFVAAAVFANVYPFAPAAASTEVLTALHLPIALWLVVGVAYAGGRWSQVAGRMDFIRFSGELFIYYVLIALGGGVLTGFMAMIFQAIGVDVEPFFQSWLLPCGAAGAVLVASWLVEAKQSVIENMAPVLTRLFTPAVRRRAGHVPGRPCCGPDAASTSSGTCSSPSTCCWWWCWPSCSTRSPRGTPVAARRLRRAAGGAGGQRAAGRCGGAVGHRRAHQRVRLHARTAWPPWART